MNAFALFVKATATRANNMQASALAVALIHRLRKLFQEFPETVRNWLCKTKIVLRPKRLSDKQLNFMG
jgi:hypothetical protein